MGNDLKYGLVLGAVVLLIFVGYYAIRVKRPDKTTKPATTTQRSAERPTAPNIFEPPSGTYAAPAETTATPPGNIAIFEPTVSDTVTGPGMAGQTYPSAGTVAFDQGVSLPTGSTYRPPYLGPTAGTTRPVTPPSTTAAPFSGTTRQPVSLDNVRPASPATKTYKIQDGDTLGAISRKFYGTDDKWQKILDANKSKNLDPRRLVIGTEIVIPDVKETASVTPATRPAAATTTAGRTHTVQQGDTLWSIARKYYGDGTKADKILQANKAKLPDADRLQVGMVLTIP